MVDITEMYPGLQVRIRGGLDIVNNKMTLDFQTVESVTGVVMLLPFHACYINAVY